MKCKKHNIIPKGLRSNFLLSISRFSQSGQRLCERFQKKLLNRILSDKYWLMEKFKKKCISLQEELRCFNLGSRFYKQNDQMINNKADRWRLMNNRRLSQKFNHLRSNSRTPNENHMREKIRIEEAKKVCDRKRVYNLSGEDIPKETEELIGRLVSIFNLLKENFLLLRLFHRQSCVAKI